MTGRYKRSKYRSLVWAVQMLRYLLSRARVRGDRHVKVPVEVLQGLLDAARDRDLRVRDAHREAAQIVERANLVLMMAMIVNKRLRHDLQLVVEHNGNTHMGARIQPWDQVVAFEFKTTQEMIARADWNFVDAFIGQVYHHFAKWFRQFRPELEARRSATDYIYAGRRFTVLIEPQRDYAPERFMTQQEAISKLTAEILAGRFRDVYEQTWRKG